MRKILSLVISTAMLFASFTTYAQTETENFELLQALNIVEGYEDGSLKLDNDITRDEATKVIVAMINKGADAKASMGKTEFPDATEWASGYINVATANDIIDGFEDGTFRPKDNVTYAQTIKMIMCALGYKDYAESLINSNMEWYIPYIRLAEDADITKGVYADPNEAITRGDVFKLVENAINAPIVKTVGISYTDSGKIVPKIQIQDGADSSVYYRSLLTEKFDIYLVEGTISKTNKDESGLKLNEVDFNIEKTKKYDEINVLGPLSSVTLLDTNLINYKGMYATVALRIDDDEDWTIVSFVPSNKNHGTTLNLVDLDKEEWDISIAKNELRFFTNNSKISTKYPLAAVPTIYVNGVAVIGTVENLEKYIKNGFGHVSLVDSHKVDGKYDKIYVDTYVTGIVSNVSSNGKIILEGAEDGIYSVTLDDENTDLNYNIYYNNEEISIDDLCEDDVLSIAYDINAGNSIKQAFNASRFYDIYVSRDILTDTLRGKNANEQSAKFGDTYYEFIPEKYALIEDAELGNEYTVYLDAFGRVFDCEINSSSANWGIMTKFYITAEDDDYKINIYTAEGSKKTYYVDDRRVDITTIDTTVGVEDRVIKYKVSSSTGKIIDLDFVNHTAPMTNKEEYKSRNNTIGSIRLGDMTKIIDATEWDQDKELTVSTLKNLVNENKYKAYAYGEKIDGIYPFVLITEGEGAYTVGTRFAVITKDGYSEVIDDVEDVVYEIEALYEDKTSLIVSDDVLTSDLENLRAGNVIYFTVNEKGYIKDFDIIFNFNGAIPSQNILAGNSLKADNTTYTNLTDITIESVFGGNFSTDYTTAWEGVSNEAIQLVYGPVIERTETDITFAKIDSTGKTNILTDGVVFDTANDINIYTYDYSVSKDYRFDYAGNAVSAIIPSRYHLEADDQTIDWSKLVDEEIINHTNANFAFAVVADGEIIDIIEFISK